MHRVECVVYEAGLALGDGRFPAVCGHNVVAAPLMTEDGRPCRLCLAIKI